MTTTMTLRFMAIFAIPITYFRLQRLFRPNSFLRLNMVRRLFNLNLHHGHIGFFAVWSIGALLIVCPAIRSIEIAQVFVFSSGLLCDELPAYFSSAAGATRESELETYDRSFHTMTCLALVVETIIAASCHYVNF